MPCASETSDALAIWPISACEDDEGSPSRRVSRFQKIPPSSPARMIVGVIAAASTMSAAIVAATFSETNAPTKFRIAERPTATLAASARVAIDVAIASVVSWNPFVKSKASATATSSTRTMSCSMRRKLPRGACARAPVTSGQHLARPRPPSWARAAAGTRRA